MHVSLIFKLGSSTFHMKKKIMKPSEWSFLGLLCVWKGLCSEKTTDLKLRTADQTPKKKDTTLRKVDALCIGPSLNSLFKLDYFTKQRKTLSTRWRRSLRLGPASSLFKSPITNCLQSVETHWKPPGTEPRPGPMHCLLYACCCPKTCTVPLSSPPPPSLPS